MTLLLAHEIEQVAGVARVEHAEARCEPERGGVSANHPVGDRVERAAHDTARVRDDPLGQRSRAFDHLARRAPREREQQDPLCRHTLGHEPRDAGAQRCRLARSGSREDQERAVRMGRGGPLLGVERIEPHARIAVGKHGR